MLRFQQSQQGQRSDKGRLPINIQPKTQAIIFKVILIFVIFFLFFTNAVGLFEIGWISKPSVFVQSNLHLAGEQSLLRLQVFKIARVLLPGDHWHHTGGIAASGESYHWVHNYVFVHAAAVSVDLLWARAPVHGRQQALDPDGIHTAHDSGVVCIEYSQQLFYRDP